MEDSGGHLRDYQEDIRRSGATTIPEALRLAPGVEVARIDGNKWAIGIRGFGSRLSRSVLVLIDGRTVYTTLFAGTYWEVQNVLLEDIDRIEVIRGPGGTIWGPNAVDGVINIITKSTKDTQGALVSAGGGNEEQGFFNTRYGGGNGKGLDYRVYGMGFNRGPEFHPDGRNFDRWRAAQGGFRMDLAANGRDKFTLQGDLYDEGAGESVEATSYTRALLARSSTGTHAFPGATFLAGWKRTLGEGDDIQVQAYYDRTNRHEPNFTEIRDTFDVDFMERFRLAARTRFPGDWARASAGAQSDRGFGTDISTRTTDRRTFHRLPAGRDRIGGEPLVPVSRHQIAAHEFHRTSIGAQRPADVDSHRTRPYGRPLPTPYALPRMGKGISSSRDILARVLAACPFLPDLMPTATSGRNNSMATN